LQFDETAYMLFYYTFSFTGIEVIPPEKLSVFLKKGKKKYAYIRLVFDFRFTFPHKCAIIDSNN